MAEAADVLVHVDLGLAEVAGQVARALGYPPPAVPAGAVDVSLPAAGARPEMSVVDLSSPGAYAVIVWAGDRDAADLAAARVYEALAAATPWALELDPEDGRPPRAREALRTSA